MDRCQAHEGSLVGAVEVIEVTAAVVATGETVTIFRNRLSGFNIFVVGKVEEAQPVAVMADGLRIAAGKGIEATAPGIARRQG